ncbi:phage/plasmid primase, P4 family [Bilifractor sp. LCP19S3_H10]|uniref:phage/plasmid primase, P4 family n=1 Tax=Lachnospiraceae TaxID=186803 RepID=UPI003F91D11E
MQFDLYVSRKRQNRMNCSYPDKVTIHSPEELQKAMKYDFVCARYKNNYRKNDNFLSTDIGFWDCDNSGEDDPSSWVTPEKVAEIFKNVSFVIMPSRHHMLPKKNESARPRFHMIAMIHPVASYEDYRNLKAEVQKRFPFFDQGAVDAARFVYGCDCDLSDIIWNEGTMTMDEFLLHQREPRGEVFSIIPEGRRNATLSRFAGRVVKRFGCDEAAHQVFLSEADKCEPPLPDSELSMIWHSACSFGKKIAAQPGYVSPEEYNGSEFENLDVRHQDGNSTGMDTGKDTMPAHGIAKIGSLRPSDYTDIGQAKALAAEYGNELRFNPSTDFLRYDGACWQESKELALGATIEFTDLQLADASMLVFQRKNELLNSGIDIDTMKETQKKKKKNPNADTGVSDEQMKLFIDYEDAVSYESFVMGRRNWKYVKAAMDTSKALLPIDLKNLDQNEYLLNTPEATYDLRFGVQGKLDHNPQDYITKMTEVDPGDQGSELWLDTLNKIFLGDKDLIDYVQQVVGLAAIGKVYQEALIIAYGGGRNGKSTFWNTISHVLGTYAGRLSADTLTVGCRRNVKPELAETFGKRLIIAAELEEGTRLNTSIVKQICSTDDVFAEKKYKDPFFFTPTHTVILYTNHLPRVGATDDGTWRRLIVIPFKAKFEKENDTKNFASVLFDQAGPAILKWIMEGAKIVIEKDHKIEEPKVVKDAIAEYREQNNWMQQFLMDCCEVEDDPTVEVKSGELYQTYREYCIRMGEFCRSTTDFYSELEHSGFMKHRTNKGVFVRGLRLKVEEFQ